MLSDQEKERYNRNIVLKQVGFAGQEKLKQSSVLVVGAGGLGSPAALYLAAAGVGRIGLVDSDVVELSNLQRQILHKASDIGRAKVDSGSEAIRALNNEVKVDTYYTRLTSDNAFSLVHCYDIVVDAVDNFPTRYLINDACVKAGKTLVEAGVSEFNGLLMVIKPGTGPCYRCVFPEAPERGDLTRGVISPLPGVVGVLQAMEAIKVLLDTGEPLIGRMLFYDSLDADFRQVELQKDPNCPACGGLQPGGRV